MNAASAQQPVTTRLALFHGLGSLAYGIKDNGFSTFLLLFYNQVLGMDPRLVSLALAIALVIDGVVDPVIGYLSDRTYSRWGRRLPWLYIAPIPLGLAWALLWTNTGNPSLFGLVLMAVLVRVLISCCEVPSVALVPELTRDYDERTTLMRFRFLFGWGGGLLLMLLAYTVFLAPRADGSGGLLDPQGYQAYGLFGAVVMTLAVLVSALGQHRRAAGWPPRARSPFSLRVAFAELRESLSHPAFLVLLAGGGLAYTSQGITFSIGNYLFLYVWRLGPQDLMVYPLVLFASVVVCFAMLPMLHRRWGKRDTAVVAAVLGAVLWMAPYLLRMLGAWPQEGTLASTAPLFACSFASNVFSVAAMISASSMIADVVEASEEQTGRRTEGAFFAGNMFMTKCATGLGIFLTGQILYLAGLPDNAKPGQVPTGVVDSLALIYIALVAVFAVLVAMVLRRFPITRADHEARLAALDAAARVEVDGTGMHP